MKIILSRKGFDSENGGYPSPIMPDGRLLSLPIPIEDNVGYSDLKVDNKSSYFEIMEQLNENIKFEKEWVPLTPDTPCHLDPDLFEKVLYRKAGWRACFGQLGTAQGHLSNMDIGIGDVFLYFGWFRKTIKTNKLEFDRNALDQHIIFGYLQIGEIIHPQDDPNVPDWLSTHPHVSYQDSTNTIYIARETFSWNQDFRGAGVFDFDEGLVLTKKGLSRSKWNLPEIFKNVDISYHDRSSWKDGYFQSVGRGQEFVVTCDSEIEDWTKQLIINHARHNKR